jgi:hypothetical protein
MEIGGSSESQNETKKGKSKTPRKPKESLLKQSQCFSLWIHYKNPILVRPFSFLSLLFFFFAESPAEFFAENKNIAGFDNVSFSS